MKKVNRRTYYKKERKQCGFCYRNSFTGRDKNILDRVRVIMWIGIGLEMVRRCTGLFLKAAGRHFLLFKKKEFCENARMC